MAFGQLGSNRRLGYLSINNNTGSDYLNLDTFRSTQRTNWFLAPVSTAQPPCSAELLLLPDAFTEASQRQQPEWRQLGQDPIQYSCQKNYTIPLNGRLLEPLQPRSWTEQTSA